MKYIKTLIFRIIAVLEIFWENVDATICRHYEEKAEPNDSTFSMLLLAAVSGFEPDI